MELTNVIQLIDVVINVLRFLSEIFSKNKSKRK